MVNALEDAAASILRSSPEIGVPIRTLHRTLESRLGPEVGDPAKLYERLRKRDDLFFVFEPRVPAWTAASFESEAEPALAAALAEAGLDTGPRVILRDRGADAGRDADRQPNIARTIEGALVGLLELRDDPADADLDGEILEAMRQVSAVARRLTTYRR